MNLNVIDMGDLNDITDIKTETSFLPNTTKARNQSEKRRRDQFNTLLNELGAIVSNVDEKKLDKSGILRATIAFLKKSAEVTQANRAFEIDLSWKPSFLTNDEFSQIMMESTDGFSIACKKGGDILHLSENVTSLLHLLPAQLVGTNFFDLVHESDRVSVKQLFESMDDPPENRNFNDLAKIETEPGGRVQFTCNICTSNELEQYENVSFCGKLRWSTTLASPVERDDASQVETKEVNFLGIGRLTTPILMRELSVSPSKEGQYEFTSRHSLEWKFLFLDIKASPIIGYMPFEVLGTSSYEYIHMDDLADLIDCHENLLRTGEGTSGYYRFLIKGQQYIWLKSHYYITYHQWNSRPEFIRCQHSVKSYAEVLEGRKEGLKRSEAKRKSDKKKKEAEEQSDKADPFEEGMEMNAEACDRMDRKHKSAGSTSSRSSKGSKKRRKKIDSENKEWSA